MRCLLQVYTDRKILYQYANGMESFLNLSIIEYSEAE
jgi:hypothetical protein